jgi:hypothetical protein
MTSDPFYKRRERMRARIIIRLPLLVLACSVAVAFAVTPPRAVFDPPAQALEVSWGTPSLSALPTPPDT